MEGYKLKTLFKMIVVSILLVSSPLYSQSQTIESEEIAEIKASMTKLESDVAALQMLLDGIESAAESDRTQLLYRQDERIFTLLAEYDTLAGQIDALPEGSPQKKALTEQLTEIGRGSISEMDSALFARIDDIQQQIAESNARITEQSGATLMTTRAYVQSLESIRIRYFETLASHVKSRDRLGLSTEMLRERLSSAVYIYAESLTGRIEFTGAARNKLQDHQSQVSDNPDINSALKALTARHESDLQRLAAIIEVLETLGIDNSSYKAVMLQEASSLSINFFSLSAIGSVLRDSWSSLKDATKENAPDLIFRFLLFIAVLLIFRTLSRVTKKIVRTATDKSKTEMSTLLKNILVSTSGGVVMALGVLMALSQVGISLGPMLAGLGVAGFIVGFALQDSLGNFASGAMILAYRPFDVGDLVAVTGASGLVKKMNLVSTTIVTLDNQTLVVPNSKIWGDVIKNVTAQTERRVDLEFGIGYDDDIDHAERVLNDLVSAHEKILSEPDPVVKLHTLGDSSVNFIVRAWTRTEDYWDVYWDLVRGVKQSFDREGISIPFPQRDVHLYTQKD